MGDDQGMTRALGGPLPGPHAAVAIGGVGIELDRRLVGSPLAADQHVQGVEPVDPVAERGGQGFVGGGQVGEAGFPPSTGASTA
jgi:hypothetical protein